MVPAPMCARSSYRGKRNPGAADSSSLGPAGEDHESPVVGKADLTKRGGSGRDFGEGDGVAEGSEPFGVIAGEPLGVQAVEVVATQLAVRLAVPQDVVGDDQDAVGHGDNGLL